MQRRLQEAIQKYLQEKSANTQQRTLQFDLAATQQRTVANSSSPITVRGGNSPWNGNQKLTISVETTEGQASFPLEVRVSTPSAVAAAVDALPRGTVIHASDLALVNGDPRDDDKDVFHSLEEVVGKQTTKTIAEGKALTPDAVQSPLVRRGDVVSNTWPPAP